MSDAAPAHGQCDTFLQPFPRGQVEQARASYLTAVSLSPGDVQAHYNLAVLYWKQADWPEVVKEFNKVIELDPSNQQARGYLAQAQQHIK